MVRVEVGGKPILDVEYKPAADAMLTETIRVRRAREPNGGQMHFGWDNVLPRLVLTSDTPDFDQEIVENWKDEGFQVAYLPYDGDKKDYHNKLQHLADPLELGEKYAIVAYSDAASLCLSACIKPMPKLVALVAYYPPYLPHTTTAFPPSLDVLIHLASAQNTGTRHPSHTYPSTQPGFAESDLDEYDKPAARLSWSRTLGLVRRAFGIYVDLERLWDRHTELEFVEKDAEATMQTMVPEPYVNHIPTMTGGVGFHDLRRFYKNFFIPGNPPDLAIKVLSRTVGADRIVDEMLCTFTHSMEVPWMLPGVPRTGKKVEVVVVGVIGVRGGKLHHEHIHWDQASVLVQIGLLDPGLVPKAFRTSEKGREKEVKRLPVVGAEGARKCVDETVGKSNELIPGWPGGKSYREESRPGSTGGSLTALAYW